MLFGTMRQYQHNICACILCEEIANLKTCMVMMGRTRHYFYCSAYYREHEIMHGPRGQLDK